MRIDPRSLLACIAVALPYAAVADQTTVADTLSAARSSDGRYISWREHIIDDSLIGGEPDLAGADGLAMADLNGDGFEDIVSVHESDTVYDGKPQGFVRIAWGTGDPQRWELTTLASGAEAAGAEDVAIADANGDGHPDIIVANVSPVEKELKHVSIFLLPDNPLDGDLWREQLLGKIRMRFAAHNIVISSPALDIMVTGFNMDYADIDGDGRLDIVINAWFNSLVWLRQPADFDAPWVATLIGEFTPDWLASVALVDVDGDGDLDVFSGGYSRGPRDIDSPDVGVDDPLGRIGWFENPGEAQNMTWVRHDISRRKRGMYDQWLARDMDDDGDLDMVGTRGNSFPYDGLVWLEQVRSDAAPHEFEIKLRIKTQVIDDWTMHEDVR